MSWLSWAAPCSETEWDAAICRRLLTWLPVLPDPAGWGEFNAHYDYNHILPSECQRRTHYRFLLAAMLAKVAEHHRQFSLSYAAYGGWAGRMATLLGRRPGLPFDWSAYRELALEYTVVHMTRFQGSLLNGAHIHDVYRQHEANLLEHAESLAWNGWSNFVADAIRECVGYPWRPHFPARWRTPDAVSLAAEIWDTRAWGQLPILADALEEAGCHHDATLRHLRDPHATHEAGCWALTDVLLPPLA